MVVKFRYKKVDAYCTFCALGFHSLTPTASLGEACGNAVTCTPPRTGSRLDGRE